MKQSKTQKDNQDQKKFCFITMLICGSVWDHTNDWRLRDPHGWSHWGRHFTSSKSAIRLLKKEDPKTIDWESTSFSEENENAFNGTDCPGESIHTAQGVVCFTNGNKYNLGCILTLTEIANVLKLTMGGDLDTLIEDALLNLAP